MYIIHAQKHIQTQNFRINFIKIICTLQREQLFCEMMYSQSVKIFKQAWILSARNAREGIPDPRADLIRQLINSFSFEFKDSLKSLLFPKFI